MRRSALALTAALCVGAVAAAGCSSGSGSSAGGSGGEITISVVSNFTPDIARGKVLNQLMADFNKQHAGKIKAVPKASADWPSLQQKLKTQISAGQAPDVFLYNFNPSDLTKEKSGKLMDWSTYLTADPTWKARFSADDLKKPTVSGQVMAIPAAHAPALFYYNKSLFAQAGIASFPTTWDEWFADAQKLKAKGIAPLAMMTADDGWYSMNALSYLTLTYGGPNAFAGTTLNQDAVAKGAADLKKVFGETTKDAVGSNYAAASANFLNGRAAMVIDGPWLISSIQSEMKNPCDVAVAAGPTGGGGQMQPGTVVTDALDLWGAAKQTSKAKTNAVVAWMKFLTSPQNAATMAVEGQYPPAAKVTLTGSELSKANCQMKQVIGVTQKAPTTVVEMERNLTTGAQAQVPSLLEGLAQGSTSPENFASNLVSANK
jgi:ABC-type glycerol-3-phosphate transport system substrate-binding protein